MGMAMAMADCIREMMISELQKGHRAATELLLLPASRDSAVDLTDRIINSFSNSLSMLSDHEFETTPPLARSGDRDSKNIAPKIRRGCYKRRKTGQTRVVVTPSFAADGYAWRKYGQKPILNSQYPRQYYRCTHKTEQGCQATKWVQRVSDRETSFLSSSVVQLYRTLYEGEHTCKTSPPPPPQIGSADLDNYNLLLGNSQPSTVPLVQVQVPPPPPPSSSSSATDYNNLYLNFGDPASKTTINVPNTGTNITAIDTNNNNNNNHSSSCGSGGTGTHGGCLFLSSSSISLAGEDHHHHHHEMLATTTSSSTTIYDKSAKLEAANYVQYGTNTLDHQMNTTDDYKIMPAAAQLSPDDYFDGIFDVDLSPL